MRSSVMKPLLIAVDAKRVLFLRASKKIDLGPAQDIVDFTSCDNAPLSWRLNLDPSMIAILLRSFIIP